MTAEQTRAKERRTAGTQVGVGGHAVGRIIARPFTGPDAGGVYQRTHRRRDFALKPTEPTVLDRLGEIGVRSYGIGKIGEIFAWQGICESPHSENNMHGVDNLIARINDDSDSGFVFANLVDFDMIWGHRNDAEGYARGLEEVDERIPELLDTMIDGDLFILTADHGCDPTTDSTDHSREFTPLIALVKGVSEGARRFTAVAVAADNVDPWPCGICRQMLNEFSLDMRVICGSRASGKISVLSLKDLLPHSFGPEDLR